MQLSWSHLSMQDFFPELICLLLGALYFWWYRRGRAANASIAIAWRRATRPVLAEEFTKVGSSEKEDPDGKAGRLQRDGPADFVLMATGREGIDQLTCHLKVGSLVDAHVGSAKRVCTWARKES